MKALIVNDDGIYAAGIRALAAAMLGGGFEVNVVAPLTERSGAAHSITQNDPVEVFDVSVPGLPDVPAFAISGTPVDCVRIGAGSLFPVPDIVLSGINLGTNLGVDIFHSGTVNAAAAAIEKGLPAMAFSIGSHHPGNLDLAAELALKAVRTLLPKAAESGTLLNFNFPDLPREQIRGVKVTVPARADPNYPFNEFISPHKRRWYWDSAAKLNRYGPDEDVDSRWFKEGYITVAPLKFDIADKKALALLGQTEIDLL